MDSFIGDESTDIIPASPDGDTVEDPSKFPRNWQQRHFGTFQHRPLNSHKAYGISDQIIAIPDSDEELDSSKQSPPLNNDVQSNVINCSDDSIINTSDNGLTNSYLNESFRPLKKQANSFNPMLATSSTPTLSRSWRDTTKLDSSLEEDEESFVISPQQRLNGEDDSDESDPDESLIIKRNYFKVARNSVDSLILTPENINKFDNVAINSSDENKVYHNLDDSEIEEKKVSRRTAKLIYSDEENEDHVNLSLTESTGTSKTVNVPDESPSKLYKGKYKIKKKTMSTSVATESDNSFINDKSLNMSVLSNKAMDCSPSGNKSMNISTSSVTSLDISSMSQAEVENALKRNKKLLKTANLSILPDQGRKIQNRISALEESLSFLNIENENSLEDEESGTSSVLLPSLNASADSIYSINTSTDESIVADDDIVEIDDETPSYSYKPNEDLKATKPDVEVYGNQKDHHIGTDLQVLKEELLEKQRIFMATNQRSLPDGGARLREEISSLQGKIMMAEWKGANLDYGKSSNDPDVIVERERPKYSQAPLMSNALQLSATNQATESSKYHLPQHVLESMYDETKDYGARDYGGKLSAAREMDMVRVTAGAVEGLHRILKSMPDVEKEEEPQPDGIKVPLMPHQRRALCWLLWRENQNPPGGILADDMGLGKTLTMLSLILKHKELIEEGKMADDFETLGERNRHNDNEWIRAGGGLKKKPTTSRGTLVVCPASLLGQWEGEAKKRISRRKLSMHVYHGNNRDLSLSRLSQFDIVVTTYQIVMREAFNPSVTKTKKKNQDDVPEMDAQHQGRLFQVGWTRIILDESHIVRNHKSQTSQAVCMLKGGRRWAVTGTPIQNTELDMYSIVRFLRVDPFENYTCWKHQVQNQSAHGLMKLNLLVRTLMLRRTKDQVDQATGETIVALPPKEVVHHSLSLTQEERQVYDRVFAFSRSSLIEYMKSQEEKENEKLNRNGQSSKPLQAVTDDRAYEKYMPTLQCDILKTEEIKAHHMLVLLLRLRQICCHPSLIKGIIEDETKATDSLASDLEKKEDFEVDLISQMNEMSLKDGLTTEEIDNRVKDEILTADNPVFKKKTISSKILEVLNELDIIRKKETSEKAVIVSQWSSMLEIVYKHLTKRGIKTTAITGQIPVKCRGALVDEFNNDPKGPQVMLLSLGAGGVGLNLVGANHLFLIDMHWNPQLEKQACDRIYRVGQKKPVKIHRFIVQNTVEEKILELQKKKLALADDVLSGAKRSDMSNKLTLQDMKSLFGIA